MLIGHGFGGAPKHVEGRWRSPHKAHERIYLERTYRANGKGEILGGEWEGGGISDAKALAAARNADCRDLQAEGAARCAQLAKHA